MLAIADGTPNLGKLLYYNETKCKKGGAECIYAANFVKDADQLTHDEKEAHFSRRAAVEGRITWNGFKAFLEFHPTEHPDTPTLIDIARGYMQRMGFGAQPYLVYNHTDTAISHLHILGATTLPYGGYMSLHHIGELRSEPVRKELEKEFGLVPAGKVLVPFARKNPAEQVRYGAVANWPAISDTLKHVLDTYSFRSVSELNAILKLYNLTALTGRPGSRLHNFHGLLYQILDEEGKNRGVPIKASALPYKPTLRFLEQRFARTSLNANSVLRVRLALDSLIGGGAADVLGFADGLRAKQIEASPVFEKDGSVAAVHFVDMRAKTVVGPHDLGVDYDVAGLRARLGFEPFVRDGEERRRLAAGKTQGKERSEDMVKSRDRVRKQGRHL